MALAAVKTFSAGEVLSASDLNALNTNILNNANSLISPFTANVAAGGFILTGLGAGAASGNSLRYEQVNGVVTTAGDTIYATAAGTLARLAIGTARQQLATNAGATAPEWVSSLQSLMTTTGDFVYASAANTAARLPAKADVAAHATTADPWVAREIILTGVAVTFTDIADAPYVGAVAWVKQNAAHVWTNGAVFSVQGAANYTAAAGDWVRIYATTVSTFEVTIFNALGPTEVATQAQQETAASVVAAVTPGRQQFHPSAAKGWVLANYAGGAVASYNVTSITDTGTGKIGVTWATDFSGANYACVAVIDTTSFISARIQNGTSTAGTIEVDSFTTTTGADADGTQVHVVAFGDQ